MINQALPAFLNVVPGGVATLRIPRYEMTINRITLELGGTTFTKALITDIKVKLGVRTVWNVNGSAAGGEAGTRLDQINRYKGLDFDAKFLTIDFSERDAPSIQGKEIGGYDLSVIKDDMIIEVTIAAGAVAPTLNASLWMTPPQGNPLINKLLYMPASTNAAGKFALNFNPQGALIKRAFMFYGGADWTGVANGNLNALEVKKDGLVVHDLGCLRNRFVQKEYRKVPQTKLYVFDPIVDNNASAYLKTADAKSLEFNAFLTAADSLHVYFELLDAPYNA